MKNKDCCAALAILVSRLSDLAQGYSGAADRAADPMMVALLSHLFSTHLAHRARLVEARQGRGAAGIVADPAGQSEGRCFGHIDALGSWADVSMLPVVLEAESRIVTEYGHVLAIVSQQDGPLRALLLVQRAAVQSRIDMLRGLLPHTLSTHDFKPQFRRVAGSRADL